MLGCVSRASSHLLAYSLSWPSVLPLLLPSLVLGGQRDTMVTFDSRLSQLTDCHTTCWDEGGKVEGKKTKEQGANPKYYFLKCVCVFACMYVHHTHTWALGDQKRELVPLELELETIVRD